MSKELSPKLINNFIKIVSKHLNIKLLKKPIRKIIAERNLVIIFFTKPNIKSGNKTFELLDYFLELIGYTFIYNTYKDGIKFTIIGFNDFRLSLDNENVFFESYKEMEKFLNKLFIWMQIKNEIVIRTNYVKMVKLILKNTGFKNISSGKKTVLATIPKSEWNKNPESKKCIFQTPDQMREFLNKHLKDRWSWRKNEIVVQAGPANWKIARAVEDFFTLAGFAGAGSEMDNIGNVVVRAYVPKSIMALKDKE